MDGNGHGFIAKDRTGGVGKTRVRTGLLAPRSAAAGWLLICLAALLAAAAPGSGGMGPYLGCGPAEFEPSGFFRVAQAGGRWWFVTPDGRRFISRGVNHVVYAGYYCPALGYSPYHRVVQELYGNTAAWAEKTRARIIDWGFNTVGAWSDHDSFEGMPYVINLSLSNLGGADWVKGKPADVFDPAWEAAVRKHCVTVCAPLASDPFLIGYFTDNELHWGPDWRTTNTLLKDYLALPEGAPGNRAARDFVKEHGRSGQAAEEFARAVAEKYFSVTTAAVKDADPHHLLLGCRFHALGVPAGVIQEAGKYVDVVSVNFYDMLPRLATAAAKLFGNVPMAPHWLASYARLSGRPLLLTEFSYRAMDSGLPNTQGAGSLVLTQRQRAARFERYAIKSLAAPYVIGYHWFNYMDEPFLGRFDGENGNYGLVNGRDRPYRTLAGRMKEVNTRACELHQGRESEDAPRAMAP